MSSKPRGLQSEVDPAIAKKAFELVRTTTRSFEGWSGKDIARLIDYVKIISFQKNVFIAKKGESIDFLGMILSGRILAVDQEMAISAMTMGDVIGYMNWVNLPGSTPNRFDLKGEKEGYIAILEMNDLKAMQKRDPYLAFQITKMCAKIAIETVSQQYEGRSVTVAEVIHEVAEISKNKLMDMLVGCPGFGQFFQSFDTKEKRLFVNMCDIVEIKSEKKYIGTNTPVRGIIIILKGELISFTSNGPGDIHRAGDILGIREVLYDQNWKDNMYGRMNGYLVKVNKDFLNDLGSTFAKSAMSIMDYFVKWECTRIKNRYKNASKPMIGGGSNLLGDLNANDDDENEAKRASEMNKFVELYMTQKVKGMASYDSNMKEDTDLIKISKDYPPIMSAAWFKTAAKQDIERAAKKEKGEDHKEKHSAFIRDKLEYQYNDWKKKEKEMKLRKKKGQFIDEAPIKAMSVMRKPGIVPIKNPDSQTLEALENEYERLKNDYNLREASRERLNSEFEHLRSKLNKTEEDVKRLKDKNIFVTAERDRLKMHNELIMKASQVQPGESLATKFMKVRSDQRSFNDVFKEQIKASRKFKLVEECAYKWLNKARKNISDKIKRTSASMTGL